MLIVADEAIPCVKHYFGFDNEIILKPGRALTRNDVLFADILLVRSVTKVNRALLEDTRVRFVGSTVTGTDHLDIDWLNSAGIQWSAAPGCNTVAVAEYTVSVIAALQKKGLLLQKNCRAGVIGVGRIGSEVVKKLEILHFDVVQCDPVRALQDKNFSSTPIEDFSELDIIFLHTPLTKEGPYPTYHLIEKSFLKRQKKDCILLNAGRGAVINFSDLMTYGRHLIWCLDVWENEPHINKEVLFASTLASPHIAGHSLQSKYRGIDMIYKAAVQMGILPDPSIKTFNFPTTEISFSGKKVDWRDIVLAIYNPLEISEQMKQAYRKEEDNGLFDALRKRFIRGHEFKFVTLKNSLLTSESARIVNKIFE
jgi:erythronate-4-phosphate dehydrogenase